MLSINVHVSPRAAILAGKTRVGSQSLAVEDSEVAVLPEALRFELALAFESGEPLGKDPSEPAVTEPSMEAIRPVLEARAARRKVVDEEKRKQAARDAEVAAVSAREATAMDNARSRALRAWIDKHGDDEQRARMTEGFLPEEEILDAICDELLDLPGFSNYDPLHKGHACDCACAGKVKITEDAPRHMDSFQFARLQTAREAAPAGATVTVVEHRAACPACNCAPIGRLEARVTMAWHGWMLVRQYALV